MRDTIAWHSAVYVRDRCLVLQKRGHQSISQDCRQYLFTAFCVNNTCYCDAIVSGTGSCVSETLKLGGCVIIFCCLISVPCQWSLTLLHFCHTTTLFVVTTSNMLVVTTPSLLVVSTPSLFVVTTPSLLVVTTPSI